MIAEATQTIHWGLIDSPIGPLFAAVSARGLCALEFDGGRRGASVRRRLLSQHPGAGLAEAPAKGGALEPVRRWLAKYFGGDVRRADTDGLTLDLVGSPFELSVWKALLEIPPGETVSYGEIARRIGHTGAARAVGLAVGHNPIPVLVPCHRVVGADGSLTGFGGGLPRKRKLLELEGVAVHGTRRAGRVSPRQLSLEVG